MSYFSASQNKDASSVNYNLPPATLEDDSNAQNDASFDTVIWIMRILTISVIRKFTENCEHRQ